jgi:hypothetical protein
VSKDIVKADMSGRSMDRMTVEALIQTAAGRDATPERRQEYRQEIADYALELAGPDPAPIERVLCEVAATTWFACRIAEMYAGLTQDSMTGARAESFQRRLDRAHRRFISTLKTLSLVRRHVVPVVQVNVARQQVNQLNVGDPAAGPGGP